MRYYVIEDDENLPDLESTIYVFEHIKRNKGSEQIRTLEDFTAKCLFIEGRNSFLYWESNKKELSAFEFEKKIRAELGDLQELTGEHFHVLIDQFRGMIQPLVFPEQVTRCAYGDEEKWNWIFVVAETEDRFWGLLWYTTA
jgi:hypothetical protein